MKNNFKIPRRYWICRCWLATMFQTTGGHKREGTKECSLGLEENQDHVSCLWLAGLEDQVEHWTKGLGTIWQIILHMLEARKTQSTQTWHNKWTCNRANKSKAVASKSRKNLIPTSSERVSTLSIHLMKSSSTVTRTPFWKRRCQRRRPSRTNRTKSWMMVTDTWSSTTNIRRNWWHRHNHQKTSRSRGAWIAWKKNSIKFHITTRRTSPSCSRRSNLQKTCMMLLKRTKICEVKKYSKEPRWARMPSNERGNGWVAQVEQLACTAIPLGISRTLTKHPIKQWQYKTQLINLAWTFWMSKKKSGRNSSKLTRKLKKGTWNAKRRRWRTKTTPWSSFKTAAFKIWGSINSWTTCKMRTMARSTNSDPRAARHRFEESWRTRASICISNSSRGWQARTRKTAWMFPL